METTTIDKGFDVCVYPSIIKGCVCPPVSKSLLHRHLILRCMSSQLAPPDNPDAVCRAYFPAIPGFDPGEITAALRGEDLKATCQGLRAIMAGGGEVNCEDSGSTLRFLLPLAAVCGTMPSRHFCFRGSARLSERPLAEFGALLTDPGIRCFPPDCAADPQLPFTLNGRLFAREYTVRADRSSQFASGLLMALASVAGGEAVRLTIDGALCSAPYFAMTLALLKDYGIHTEVGDLGERAQSPCSAGAEKSRRYYLKGSLRPATQTQLERDASQAAFFELARYLGQLDLSIAPLCPDPSATVLQGDAVFPQLLNKLRAARGSGLSQDISTTPDLALPLAVAMAATPGGHRLLNVHTLRFKESDRIKAILHLLHVLGVEACETASAIYIRGLASPRVRGDGGSRPELWFTGGQVDGMNDHRMVMAAAVAACHAMEAVRICGAEAVSKSHPDFFDELFRLGAHMEKIAHE